MDEEGRGGGGWNIREVGYTGAKDCQARLGGCAARGPEGDSKLKLPRFRLDEFISLAEKIARGISRTAGSRFL